MNGKKARALRKESGFKPSDERKYNALVTSNGMGRLVTVPSTKVLHETSARAKYQAAKRASR